MFFPQISQTPHMIWSDWIKCICLYLRNISYPRQIYDVKYVKFIAVCSNIWSVSPQEISDFNYVPWSDMMTCVKQFSSNSSLTWGCATQMSIWMNIFCPGNRHFLSHFLSVFIVTWSQNEPSESWEKNYPVDKYTKESNSIALFLLEIGSN